MKPPPFRYRRPASVAEAVAELAAADGRARVLAGGRRSSRRWPPG